MCVCEFEYVVTISMGIVGDRLKLMLSPLKSASVLQLPSLNVRLVFVIRDWLPGIGQLLWGLDQNLFGHRLSVPVCRDQHTSVQVQQKKRWRLW